MIEYKSLYINKTWNEITTSFDWVNCWPGPLIVVFHIIKSIMIYTMFRMSQNVLKFIWKQARCYFFIYATL